jgi:hypothetical protein
MEGGRGMRKSKDWIDYRVEELEEKASVPEFPAFDMDGTRFDPDPDDLRDDRCEDAWNWSISRRMGELMGIFNPFMND